MNTRSVVILTALVVAGLLAAWAYKVSAQQDELQRRALLEAKFQNDLVSQIEAEARQLLSTAAGIALDSERCEAAFAGIARSATFFSGLTAFDLQGDPICASAARWSKPINPKLMNTALVSEGFVIGEQTIVAEINKRVLPFAQVLRDADGQVRGVVTTMVELDRMARRIARHWRHEDATITVADRAGNILVRLSNSISRSGQRLPDELISVLGEPHPGTTKVELAAGERVEAIGYIPVTVAPFDLFVSVHFQTATLIGEIKGAFRKSVVPVTLVLLAAGLLLVLLPARGPE